MLGGLDLPRSRRLIQLVMGDSDRTNRTNRTRRTRRTRRTSRPCFDSSADKIVPMHVHVLGMEDMMGLRWGWGRWWERSAISRGQGSDDSDARLMCRPGVRGSDDHLGLGTV